MEWSDRSLYDKARLFMDRAHEQPIDSQLFAFWASLSLELLCRCALAKIHPVLLADPREDGNIVYAFGIQPAKPPKSIVTKAIVIRCTQLVTGFTEDMAKHCAMMSDRRNAELHTGVAGFAGFSNAAWLPATYEVIEVLLKHIGTSFEDFLGSEHAPSAIGMLRDRRETLKKEIMDRINGAKRWFMALANGEQKKRIEHAEVVIKEALLRAKSPWRQVECPACKSMAIISGEITSRGRPVIDESDTTITREVRVLPSVFRCPSCELSLDGFQEMHQAGLGSVYTVQENEDPVEFFGIDPTDYIDPDQYFRDVFGPEYDNE